MKVKAPRVVRKVKIEGKWVFAAVAKRGEKLDFAQVTFKGKTFPARDGSFYLDYSDGGPRQRRCVGDDPADVKRALNTQMHVLELRRRGVVAEDAPEMQRRAEGTPLEQILKEFIAHPPAGIGPATIKKYKGIMRDFFRWAATANITHAPQVTDAVLKRYIRHLEADAIEAGTIGNKISQLTSELKRHGCTFALRSSDLPTVLHKERSIYSRELLQAIFAACEPPEYALYQTFLLTGMREKEIAFLMDSDIDAARSVLRVTAKPDLGFKPKNHEERSVSVPRRLIDLLLKHMGERKGLVFATSDLWAARTKSRAGGKRDTKMLLKLKRLARRAGLNCGRCVAPMNGKLVSCKTHPMCEQFRLHKFRHTYATSMLRDRMDIESLRRQLGHKDLLSTRRYLHALEPEQLSAEVEASSLAKLM